MPEKRDDYTEWHKQGLWVTADGEILRVEDIDDLHLMNIIRILSERLSSAVGLHPFAEHARRSLVDRPEVIHEALKDILTRGGHLKAVEYFLYYVNVPSAEYMDDPLAWILQDATSHLRGAPIDDGELRDHPPIADSDAPEDPDDSWMFTNEDFDL